MTAIKFISENNITIEIDAETGTNLMQAAVDNGIDGILAECGGACSCATCHCYIDEAWLTKTGEASDLEKEMLDCVIDPKKNSRLSCQISVTDDMDGLVVHIPSSQY